MTATSLTWEWKPFAELTLSEWHDLLQLRIDVFVVEQHCPYPELDGKDPDAIHLMGKQDSRVIAVARILPPGLSYPEASIGRVATAAAFRRQGLGKTLMANSLRTVSEAYGNVPIRISAQTYLINFYNSFGFQETGKSYLEDGIPHVEMYRQAKKH